MPSRVTATLLCVSFPFDLGSQKARPQGGDRIGHRDQQSVGKGNHATIYRHASGGRQLSYRRCFGVKIDHLRIIEIKDSDNSILVVKEAIRPFQAMRLGDGLVGFGNGIAMRTQRLRRRNVVGCNLLVVFFDL